MSEWIVDTRTDMRTALQKATAAVGAVFLLVGILGFVPAIISDYDQLSFAGHDADDWLHFVLGLGMVALGVVLRRRGAR